MTTTYDQHLEEATTHYIEEGYALSVAEEYARLDANVAFYGALEKKQTPTMVSLPNYPN